MKYATLVKNITSTKFIVPVVALVAIVISYTGARTYATKPTERRSNCIDTCVSIREDGFSQSELAVKVGTFVEFRSADGKSHNLALGEGTERLLKDTHTEPLQTTSEHSHDHITGTESGNFSPDEAWKVQFKKSGTYVIHDHLNPELNILVVVYEPKSEEGK